MATEATPEEESTSISGEAADPIKPPSGEHPSRFQFGEVGFAAVPQGIFILGQVLPKARFALPHLAVVAIAATIAFAIPFLAWDVLFSAGYNPLSIAFLIYFGLFSVLITILGAAIWRSLIRLEGCTNDSLCDSEARSKISLYVSKLLDPRKQVAGMLLGAAVGVGALNVIDDGLSDRLDFGTLSYAMVALLSVVGANAVYAGITLPLLVRKLFALNSLRLYRLGPGWTPVAQDWSRFFLRYTLWSVVIFSLAAVPLAFTVAASGSSGDAFAVGASVLAISALAALWFGILPHYWIRECIVSKKRVLLAEFAKELDTHISLVGDKAGNTSLGDRLSVFRTLTASPDSPIDWVARGLAALTLASLPAIITVTAPLT